MTILINAKYRSSNFQSLVEEQMIQEAELVRLRRARYIPDIPDTLYMVDEKPRSMGAVGVDVLAAALPGIFYNISITLLTLYAYTKYV